MSTLIYRSTLLFVICLLLNNSGYSSDKVRAVVIRSSDSAIYASILIDPPSKIDADDSKTYFWYSMNEIHSNKGGFSGYLLHGKIEIFDMHKNLLTLGNFDEGLKDGNWKEWFKKIPDQDGFVYAVGAASSRNLSIASDKAVTKAQISLAEQIKNKTETPGGADTENVTDDDLYVVLNKSLIKEQSQIKDGKLWRVYILLEMQID